MEGFFLQKIGFKYTSRVARNMSDPLVVIYDVSYLPTRNRETLTIGYDYNKFKDYFFIFFLCLS